MCEKKKEKYRTQPTKRFLGIGFLVTVTQTILSMAMHGFVPNQFNTIEGEEKTSNFLPNRTLQRNVLPQEMVANINYECWDFVWFCYKCRTFNTVTAKEMTGIYAPYETLQRQNDKLSFRFDHTTHAMCIGNSWYVFPE